MSSLGFLRRALGFIRRSLVRHPDAACIALILLVGAGLRFLFFPLAPVFIHGDSPQYYLPAYDLVTGGDFTLTLKRPPAYPALLALLISWRGEDLRAIVALQHALGVVTAVLAFGVGRLAIGRAAGLAAGLAAALSGGILILEQYILTESLFAFFLTLSVLLYLQGMRSDRWLWYASSGLAIALATLTRPHALLLLLLGPLVIVLCGRGRAALWRAVAITTAVAIVLLLPWALRNQLTYGTGTLAGGIGQHLVRFTAGAHAGEFMFLDPAAALDSDPDHAEARRLIQRVADQNAGSPQAEKTFGNGTHRELMEALGLSEADADALMRDIVLETIRRQPDAYARAVLTDFRKLMVGVPENFRRDWDSPRNHTGPDRLSTLARPATAQREARYPLAEQLVSLYQPPRLGLLLPLLFVLGLLASLLRPAWRLALLPGLSVLVLHAATAATVGFAARYHQPPDPLMHALAFAGLVALWQGLWRLGRRPRVLASRAAVQPSRD